MFIQSDKVRDYIFPIATANAIPDIVVQKIIGVQATKRILGSAFFIGNQGFALTANHVIRGSESERLIAMFSLPSGEWQVFEITGYEAHPSEDVAIIKIENNTWKSPFCISDSSIHASTQYHLFGYPDDTTLELIAHNQVLLRPDLVYNEGYVRRRFTGDLPSIQGSSFIELSEVAGTGVSGAPVIRGRTPTSEVIGVYIGEKINERATSVSYAVRAESFIDWVPNLLGKSVLEESRNFFTA